MQIEEKFEELNEREEGAYMPHIYYGDPSEEFSREAVGVLAENGADLLEFGIPFSDPTADGPTFQNACERALAGGITPNRCIRGIEKLRESDLEIPIVVTTYYNIPYVFGVERFLKELNEAGAQGVIVPNVPAEESRTLAKAGEKAGIDVILQVTPNTSRDRLRDIVKVSTGFLYIVNFEGVTGVRDGVAGSTKDLIEMTREYSEIPLMAGFGISREEQAKELVLSGASGIITGSALGRIYEGNLENPEEALPEIGKFASKMKSGCVEGYRKRQ